MLLTHFGETSFTAAQCRGTCDNCAQNAGQTFAYEDVSEAAKKGAEGGPGCGVSLWGVHLLPRARAARGRGAAQQARRGSRAAACDS